MKKLSRTLAVIMVIAILVTAFAGCHPKNETAYTIGDVKFTSAMYSCALYFSASEVTGYIGNYLEENGEDTSSINYDLYKFEKDGTVGPSGSMTYSQFVKFKAETQLIRFAAVDAKLKELGITVDENTVSTAKITASYLWYVGCDYSTYQSYSSYGVDPSSYFTPYVNLLTDRGVSLSTYEQYLTYQYTYSFYFEKLYSEGGEKEIPVSELNDYLNTHYVIADTFSMSKKDNSGNALDDEAIETLKAKADVYVSRINSGEEFKTIYDEYNSTAATEDSSSATSSEEYTPEEYTSIFGDEKTSDSSGLYSDISKIDLNKASLIDDTNNSRYVVAVRRDILEHDYWLNSLRSSISFTMKEDEFNSFLDEFGATLNLDKVKSAVNQFAVEDIEIHTQSQTQAQ